MHSRQRWHAPDESADLLPELNQGISELLDSLQWFLAPSDALIQNCPIDDQLDSYQGNVRAGISHLGSAYTLWPHEASIALHQEEPRDHCTSIGSDSHSDVPDSSQGTVGYHTEGNATLSAGLMHFCSPVQLSSCNTSWFLLHALETVPGDTDRCANLEELGHLCNQIGLQVPPHANTKLEKNQAGR